MIEARKGGATSLPLLSALLSTTAVASGETPRAVPVPAREARATITIDGQVIAEGVRVIVHEDAPEPVRRREVWTPVDKPDASYRPITFVPEPPRERPANDRGATEAERGITRGPEHNPGRLTRRARRRRAR